MSSSSTPSSLKTVYSSSCYKWSKRNVEQRARIFQSISGHIDLFPRVVFIVTKRTRLCKNRSNCKNHFANSSKERNHWKLKKALITRGTLNNHMANRMNPELNNHISSRSEYKDKWQHFMDGM